MISTEMVHVKFIYLGVDNSFPTTFSRSNLTTITLPQYLTFILFSKAYPWPHWSLSKRGHQRRQVGIEMWRPGNPVVAQNAKYKVAGPRSGPDGLPLSGAGLGREGDGNELPS